MKKNNSKTAFTLVELILVIAVFSILIGSVFLNFSDFFSSQQLKSYKNSIVQSLRKAQSFSTMRIKDSEWGVAFIETANNFILFKGNNFSSRDSNYDEVYELPDSLSIQNISLSGGGNTVVFDKISGETNNNGNLDLILDSNRNYNISINELGKIETN